MKTVVGRLINSNGLTSMATAFKTSHSINIGDIVLVKAERPYKMRVDGVAETDGKIPENDFVILEKGFMPKAEPIFTKGGAKVISYLVGGVEKTYKDFWEEKNMNMIKAVNVNGVEKLTVNGKYFDEDCLVETSATYDAPYFMVSVPVEDLSFGDIALTENGYAFVSDSKGNRYEVSDINGNIYSRVATKQSAVAKDIFDFSNTVNALPVPSVSILVDFDTYFNKVSANVPENHEYKDKAKLCVAILDKIDYKGDRTRYYEKYGVTEKPTENVLKLAKALSALSVLKELC